MADLQKGYKIETLDFKSVIVVEKLGAGGQGTVYKVIYDGYIKALKWYFPNKLKDPLLFYENIKKNIENKSPSNVFLWPLDITKWKDGSFGYIMDLRPQEYKDFSMFLLAKVKFYSVEALINTALNIIEGFRALHLRGYSYQDLNDGNFFVNPKTGDVLICDNDNVAPDKTNLGIAGKCRYVAPEVVLNKKYPDKHTDRFSMSIILFLLLFKNHPLEGIATNPPCMTEELERKFYGTNPIFIFDPIDHSNSPSLKIQTNVIKLWPLFPEYIRELFIKAFSKDIMNGTKTSITDREWIEVFIRLKTDIITCTCGEETFANPLEKCQCINCQRSINVPAYLKTKKYNLPLVPLVKLYNCHTKLDSYDFTTVTGEVIRGKNNPSIIGIRNLSDCTWYVTGENGEQSSYSKDQVVKVVKGIKINFGNSVSQIV